MRMGLCRPNSDRFLIFGPNKAPRSQLKIFWLQLTLTVSGVLGQESMQIGPLLPTTRKRSAGCPGVSSNLTKSRTRITCRVPTASHPLRVLGAAQASKQCMVQVEEGR